MIRTRTILQMEAAECGAAALAIILAHHGRNEPLARLRKACGVSRDGSRAIHMLAAAREFGLKASAYRCEPEQLRRMRGPFIVFWNFNHFVVVEGFARNKVFINDPRSGRQTVTAAEFDESFTGIALTFAKGPGFQRGGARSSIARGLLRRLRGHGAGVLLVFLATLALILPVLAAGSLPKVFVDNLVIGGAYAWTRPLLLALGIAAAALGLLTYFQQRVLLSAQTRLAVKTSSGFFWHVLRLPIEFFSHRLAGEIGFRTAANERVAGLVMGDLATQVVNVLLAGICVALMLQYDVGLTLAALAVACVNAGVLRLMARRRSEASYRLAHERGKLAGIAMGGLLAIESVKAEGAEPELFRRWAGQYARAANAGQDLQSASQSLIVIPPLLASLNLALVLSWGAVRVMDGLLTIGMLIAFQALLQTFFSPVNHLMSLGGKLQEIGGDLSRLDDVLEHPLDPAFNASADAEPGERLIGHVELRGISYGYSPLEAPLIEDLNLRIAAGSRVALVGSSGSGKSTIAKLLCGLYQPWKGQILFDGRELSAIPREVVANSLALVDQDPVLFEGTVAGNIALWDDTLDAGTLQQAACDAMLAEEPDAPVEEMGRNLSGGERQRIEIARALATDPRILVLDEATSALDPITEKQVADNLRRRGCTCVIVAHRLSTIRDCDEIIVLENGRVAERGTHRQLVEAQGAYAELVAAQ